MALRRAERDVRTGPYFDGPCWGQWTSAVTVRLHGRPNCGAVRFASHESVLPRLAQVRNDAEDRIINPVTEEQFERIARINGRENHGAARLAGWGAKHFSERRRAIEEFVCELIDVHCEPLIQTHAAFADFAGTGGIDSATELRVGTVLTSRGAPDIDSEGCENRDRDGAHLGLAPRGRARCDRMRTLAMQSGACGVQAVEREVVADMRREHAGLFVAAALLRERIALGARRGAREVEADGHGSADLRVASWDEWLHGVALFALF